MIFLQHGLCMPGTALQRQDHPSLALVNPVQAAPLFFPPARAALSLFTSFVLATRKHLGQLSQALQVPRHVVTKTEGNNHGCCWQKERSTARLEATVSLNPLWCVGQPEPSVSPETPVFIFKAVFLPPQPHPCAGTQRVVDCLCSRIHQVIKVITCCSCETSQSQRSVCANPPKGKANREDSQKEPIFVCCDHEFEGWNF